APAGRERLAVRDAGTPELRITVGHVVVGVATLELVAVRRDALEVVVFATRHREAIGDVVRSQVPGAEGAHGLAVGVGAARPQPELRTVVEGHALQARRLVLRARRILGAGEELPRRQRDRGATTVPLVAVVPLLALVVVGITLTDFFDPVDLALLAHGAVLATAERDTTGAAGAAGAAGSADAARAAGAAVGRILVVSAAHAEHATGQRQHQ